MTHFVHFHGDECQPVCVLDRLWSTGRWTPIPPPLLPDDDTAAPTLARLIAPYIHGHELPEPDLTCPICLDDAADIIAKLREGTQKP